MENTQLVSNTESSLKRKPGGQKGQKPWNKGRKGVQVAWNKGKPFSEESKLKMRISKRRFLNTHPDFLAQMIQRATKNVTSVENRAKIKYHKLDTHHNWKGGKCFEEYGLSWTHELQEVIRQRDKHTCQLCGMKQHELKGFHKHLSVHHIDYDKRNYSLDNLITLCNSCHTKTSYHRDEWFKYFKNI